MSEFKGVLQIRKIRSKGQIGGIIFSAITLDDKPARYIVKAGWKVASVTSVFREGHLWNITGEVKEQTIKWNDGTEHTEKVIIPSEVHFVKASNENLKRLLSEAKEFKGISSVKAEKLVSFFGDQLYDIAAKNDVKRLLPILGEDVAKRVVHGLNECQELHALRLLDDLGVPHYIGDSVLKIWGHDAYDKIKENPYLLVVFMADLKAVDEYAINRLGISENSPLRLIAYVKEVMFNAFKNGNTCLPTSDVKYRVKRLLGDLGAKAFDVAANSGEIVVDGGIAQVRSMDIIESTTASMIADLCKFQYPETLASRVESQIDVFKTTTKIPLTDEQKEAIVQCCTSRITLLTGGAGCGKTTVIEAICFALEKLYQTKKIYLMALAGKAAKRITEATGRDAMTIASFIYNIEADDIPEDAAIIVDEASMVDVLSLLKILKKVPVKGKLILTGDDQQLPPVGIGLTLHQLVGTQINNPVLTATHRASEESGIPLIANQIRNYHKEKVDIVFREFNGISEGVSFIECSDHDMEQKALSIYAELGGNGSKNDVLLLAPVKAGGVNNLNAIIHDTYSNGTVINFNDAEFGQVTHHINGRSLRVGELVMYTKNDYEKDIRNGSVGRVSGFNSSSVVIEFDSNTVELSISELKYLEHAYSMTVHKSQGSQYERVIILAKESRSLDRHLIYTALTRAKKQALFIGNKQAFYQALDKSNASKRKTKLSQHLSNHLGIQVKKSA